MTNEDSKFAHLSMTDRLGLLDLQKDGPVFEMLVQAFNKNGNEPIPFPDNSTAPTVSKLVELEFLTQSSDGIQLSEAWLKESPL